MGNRHTLPEGPARLAALRSAAGRLDAALVNLRGRLNNDLTVGRLVQYLAGRGEVLVALDGYGGWRGPRPNVIETGRLLRDIGNALDEFSALFGLDAHAGPAAATALMVARIRETLFANDEVGWLRLCRERFGLRAPECHTYLSAGNLLARYGSLNPTLYSVAPRKLAVIAELGFGGVCSFLEQHDPSTMTEEGIRKACMQIVGKNRSVGKTGKAGTSARRNG